MERNALIVSHSVLISDPRIRRQIDWLTGAGWTVDTLGFGIKPDEHVRAHYVLGEPSPLLRPTIVKALVHLSLPPATQFRLLGESRVPRSLRSLARAGAYELVVFNELELAPWARDTRIFGPNRPTRAHLDLHEYHPESRRVDSLARRLTARRSRWTWRLIGHPAFSSRSTVASGIAELYAQELDIPVPALVRNSPPAEDLSPRPTDPHDIRLLFHGMASRVRGLGEIVAAMRQLPERFSMTFMLTPNQEIIDELRDSIADLPRVRIVDPAPMRELARRVNEYDLEIIFYPPRSLNYHYALPNKFFEAVQGRIGVVIGESPMMTELVRQHRNGLIVEGWTASDLAAAIGRLSAEDVDRFKQGAHHAAMVLNAEAEGAEFLRAIENGQR